MKIGILGGAFDPIHEDHINLAKSVLDAKVVDKVLIMPCLKHRHEKKMASYEDRLSMVKIACLQARKTGYKIFASDFEEAIDNDGSTHDLFYKYLNPAYRSEGHQVYCIIGVDNANSIITWHNWKSLIREVDFIVVNRGEYQIRQKEWYARSPHVYISQDVGKTSSTEVREAIKSGLSIVDKVCRGVANYIKKKKLYK